MKKVPKRDIDYAYRALADMRSIIVEYHQTEGGHAATAYTRSPDAVLRGQRCIAILKQAGQPMPEWLVESWAWYRVCGWHNLPNLVK